MKIKPRSKKQGQSRGFALVVTLMLLVLLVLIALAMLSLSTIEMRAAQNGRSMEEAKANARMALTLAIGELQQYASQDQRITARAEMFDKTGANPIANGSWIGVWNSSKMPNDLNTDIFTRNNTTGSLEDARTGQSNDIFFKNPLTWLVSGRSSVPGVSLIHPIVLREAVATVPEVTVEKIQIQNKLGELTGAFAWFIDDLSMKANIGQDNRKERPAALAKAGGNEVAPYFAPHGVGNYHDPRLQALKKEDIPKLVTFGTVSVPTANKDIQRELAADYTHYSVSLLTDSLNGGLKKDLTAYTKNQAGNNAASLPGWLSYGAITKDYNILETNPNEKLDLGFHTTYGPKLGLIKSWMNLPVSGSSGNYSVDPVAPVKTSYNLGAAADKSDLMEITGSSMLKVPDIKHNTSAAVHPIMVLCENQMYVFYEKDGSGKIAVEGVSTDVDYYKLHYGFFPKVVLWNPYDITMKASNYFVQGAYPSYVVNTDVQVNFKSWITSVDGSIANDKSTDFGTGYRLVANFGMSPKKEVITSDSIHFQNPISSPLFKVVCGDLAPGEYVECVPTDNVDWGVTTLPEDLVLAANSGGVNDYYKCFRVEAGLVSERSKEINSYFGSGVKMVRLAVAKTSSIESFLTSSPTKKNVFKKNWFLYSGEGAQLSWADIKNHNGLYQAVILGDNGFETGPIPYDATNIGNKGMLNLKDTGGWDAKRAMAGVFGYRYIYLDDDWNALKQYKSKFLPIAPIANANVRASWNVPGVVNSRSRAVEVAGGNEARLAPPFMDSSAQHTSNFAKQPRANSNAPSPFSFGLTLGGEMVLFDLPKPDYGVPSLGMLQHLNFSTFMWHPSYTLGNSYADIRYDREKTSMKATSALRSDGSAKSNSDLTAQGGSGSNQLLYYDLAYELNFNMWDRFFMSSNTDKNVSSNDKQKWKSTMPELGTWVSPYLQVTKSREDNIEESEGFQRVAEYLGVLGGFNPNSTSVNAWKSFLSSVSSGDEAYKGESGGKKLTTFSRSHPARGKNLDIQSDTLQDDSYWSGFRRLTDAQLTTLAEKIVEEVRKRGPFLSVGDFVNRRLDAGESGISGPLQAAIDKAGLNADDVADVSKSFYDGVVGSDLGLGLSYSGGPLDYYKNYYQKAVNGILSHDDIAFQRTDIYVKYEGLMNLPKSRTRNMAGYLQQGDILQALGPRLSTRGDSFVIRVCGESINGNKIIKAYAEAVVQRTSEPVNDAWDGIEPESKNQSTEYGRRFKIVSFRWLNQSEL